jgi:hypothetical protein
MNGTRPSMTTTPHGTRRLIGAALVGVAVGIGGVSLLSPSPADVSSAAAPVALSGEQRPTEPAAPGVDGADGPRTSGPQGVDPGPGSTGNGVVDQATAEQAALAYLGEGRVTWVSPEDDRGAAWEIEVTLPTGREVDVYVDAAGEVVGTSEGFARLLP